MKKDMIKNIVIAILSVLVLVLIIILIVNMNTKEIKYKYFNDDLIEIDSSKSFEVQANILSDNSLAVLISSDNSDNLECVLSVEAEDEKGKSVLDEERNYIMLGKSKNIAVFNLPGLGSENAGKIKIKVNEVKTNYEEKIDAKKITHKVSYKDGENQMIDVTINFINGNDTKITDFAGYLIAYKDDKIVGLNSFSAENIEPHATFTIDTFLTPNIDVNQMSKLDFDKLEVLPVVVS